MTEPIRLFHYQRVSSKEIPKTESTMSDFDLGSTQRMTTETHRTTTFLDLLRRQMSVSDRTRRKRTLKERLRFKCIACCGLTINNTTTTTNATTLHSPPNSREDEIEDSQSELHLVPGSDTGSGSGMNLATALEAERYNRGETAVDMTPRRVSLMRLLDETAERADVDDGRETEISTASMGTLTDIIVTNDSVCCVCIGRKKGAAFIPCGHTFCRVCSRELWLNRGSCPLCNRPIIEILDIF